MSDNAKLGPNTEQTCAENYSVKFTFKSKRSSFSKTLAYKMLT